MVSTVTILRWIWVAFGLHWLAAAMGPTGKTVAGEPSRWRVLRWSILAVTLILLLTSWLRLGPLGGRFIPDQAALHWLGVVITAAGLLLCVWARRSLGAYWSDKIVLKEGHQLIQTGPYARLRHPIYSGVLFAIAGTALAVGEWRGIAALALLSANYGIKARREERILASHFGEEFANYKRRAGFVLPALIRRHDAKTGL